MYTYNAKILRVIDGDTVELEIDLGFFIRVNKVARLYGIDAYEMKSRIASDREKANKGKKFVEAFLDKDVIIKTHFDQNDKYGRILVEIYTSQTDLESTNSINIQLVQEGLAVRYDGGKKNV